VKQQHTRENPPGLLVNNPRIQLYVCRALNLFVIYGSETTAARHLILRKPRLKKRTQKNGIGKQAVWQAEENATKRPSPGIEPDTHGGRRHTSLPTQKPVRHISGHWSIRGGLEASNAITPVAACQHGTGFSLFNTWRPVTESLAADDAPKRNRGCLCRDKDGARMVIE